MTDSIRWVLAPVKTVPKIGKMAALPGFTNIHPLQTEWSVYGACKAMEMLEHDLGEITGMDRITLSRLPVHRVSSPDFS